MADRACESIPLPFWSPFFEILFGQEFVEGEKEGETKDTGLLLALQPVDEDGSAFEEGRQEPMPRIESLATAEERIGGYMRAGGTHSSNGTGLDFANHGTAEREAEAIVGQKDRRGAPRAVEAAVRNLSFDGCDCGLGSLWLGGRLGREMQRSLYLPGTIWGGEDANLFAESA